MPIIKVRDSGEEWRKKKKEKEEKMDVTGYTTMSGDCSNTVSIRHNFTLSGVNADTTSPNRDWVSLVIYDGNNNAFAYISIWISVGYVGGATDFNFNYPILTQPISRPFTIKIFDNTTQVGTGAQNIVGAQEGPVLDVINFDPVAYSICQSLPLYTPPAINDGRINSLDMAAPIAVYGHNFDGDRGLVVYSNEGVLLQTILPEDLIDCPEENTLIIRNKDVSVYRLSSCEYQITAPTLDGTKTYNLIFKVFYANTGYISYEE